MTAAGSSLALSPLALAVLGVLLWAGAGEGSAASGSAKKARIERLSWEGWDEAYRLSNGEAELVVVPAVSRILHYSFAGEGNVLWRNASVSGRPPVAGAWTNYGGNKAWIWPQDDWPARTGSGWPPPTDLPGTIASTAEIRDGRSLRLTSPRIPAYDAVVVREIRLEDSGTRVVVSSRIEKLAGEATFAVAAWTVSQLPADGTLYARLMPGSRPAGGVKPYDGRFAAVSHEGPDVLVIERRSDQSAKVGMDGDLLAWQRGEVLFVERPAGSGPRLADFAPGERTQLYSHPDADPTLPRGLSYVELEITAPRRRLRAGESVTLDTTLELRRLTPEQRGRAAVASLLRGM